MKTVKLKLCNAVTLANPQAPLGKTPSGAIIFEITNVPTSVSAQDIRHQYRCFNGAWSGRKLSFPYAT